MTHQKPKRKLNKTMKKPLTDIKNKGFELKPNKPLKPIFNEPENLLYLPLPANLFSRSYSTNACLKPTNATSPLK